MTGIISSLRPVFGLPKTWSRTTFWRCGLILWPPTSPCFNRVSLPRSWKGRLQMSWRNLLKQLRRYVFCSSFIAIMGLLCGYNFLFKLLPITACTISLHLVAVEAHFQVPMTGPVRESLSSWIERLNFTLIEQTQRRYLPSNALPCCLLSRSHLLF